MLQGGFVVSIRAVVLFIHVTCQEETLRFVSEKCSVSIRLNCLF